MKFVPNSVTRVVAKQILVTQKHSPAILFGAGIAGMVSTVVMASRATLKLEPILDEANNNLTRADRAASYGRPDYTERDRSSDIRTIKVQTALNIVKLYGPTVVVGTASIACLAGSHNILNKRNVALTAAYSVVERGFSEYRKRVVEEYGEEKDREFALNLRDKEVIVETEQGPQPAMVQRTPDGEGRSMYARLFDRDTSDQWSPDPVVNVIFLRQTMQYLNDRLRAKGHVFLNEALDELGMERVPEGQIVGWIRGNGDDFIDFGLFENGNIERFRDFALGREGAVWLDFNVDGNIWKEI